METVYDKLLKLQTIPNAWEHWRDYRSALTDFVINNTLPDTTALILGAGACNDYDLTSLGAHFSNIFLLDLSEKEMHLALTKQVKNDTSMLFDKFQCIEGNLVGITPTMYRRFSARLQGLVNLYGTNTDLCELARVAIEEMEISYESRERNDYLLKPDSVDYCILCGVHSQLNNMYPWIFDAFCQALGKHTMDVHLKAREFNNTFIPKLHEQIFTASKKGVIIGAENKRVGVEGGIEGSFQAIKDLEQRIASNKNALEKKEVLYWPFSYREQIIYEMNLYAMLP